MGGLEALLTEIRACRLCARDLPHPPRPVIHAHPEARILVVGQAPGRRVHETGISFNDPSGDRLRDWMGVDRETFYDVTRIALVPMGFCYPGTGRGGDLPPRPECAATWREAVLTELQRVELTLLVGRHAIAWHLYRDRHMPSVGEVVADWRRHWPGILPMPHPSPRNHRWLRERPWFEREVVPALRERVSEILSQTD